MRPVEFKQYRRKALSTLRPYIPGETLHPNCTVAEDDKAKGSPKSGDMIARNPKDHDNQWLVEAQFFADNFEPV